jgi:hypothetical protein
MVAVKRLDAEKAYVRDAGEYVARKLKRELKAHVVYSEAALDSLICIEAVG